MKNLIGMTNFVLYHSNNAPLEDYDQVNETFVNKVINYANFLKQPLELWMFVPCDKDGNVFEEQIYQEHCNCDELDSYNNLVAQYQQAKERCLFEGFEIIKHPYNEKSIAIDGVLNVFWNNKIIGWKISKSISIIEDLVKYNLQLTATAQKQIGL